MLIPASWMPPANMQRIICHWTGGAYKANAIDKKHYHALIEGDANVVQGDTRVGSPIAHTRNLNTGSIGISMCGMGGARENPFHAGNWPLTLPQWQKAMEVIAAYAKRYGIPITPRTVLTHAEVQPTLGVAQAGKWDITRLSFAPGIVGAKAVGDKMRAEVMAAMGEQIQNAPESPTEAPTRTFPILRRGAKGEDVRLLQAKLGAGLRLDGLFGALTEGAVRNFQRAKNLVIDGIVGPATWGALG